MAESPAAPFFARQTELNDDTAPLFCENIPGGSMAFSADESASIRHINASLLELLGYAPAELAPFLGVSRKVLLHRDDRERVAAEIGAALASGDRYSVDFRFIARSGESVFVRESGKRLPFADGAIVITACLNLTDIRAELEQLRVSEEEYRLALRHTGKSVYCYDFRTGSIESPADLSAAGRVSFGGLVSSPLDPLARGLAAEPGSLEYAEFCGAMFEGKPSGAGIFETTSTATGQPVWLRADFTTIYAADGKPLRAVVTYEDVTKQREKELAYKKARSRFSSMAQSDFNHIEFNVTKNKLESIEGALFPSAENAFRYGYSHAARYFARAILSAEDRELFAGFFSRERLLASYYSGNTEQSIELRIDRGNGPRWIKCELQLISDPYSRDLKGSVFCHDIHEEKLRELELHRKLRHDPLTGLLNREAFIAETNMAFAEAGEQTCHALMMVDIDFFKQINDRYGHVFGDDVLRGIADKLRSALRQSDLAGRLGGDEFVILLKNITTPDVIAARAQYICGLLNCELGNDSTVSGSLGVAIFPRDGKTFGELYNKADIALYETKRHGRNSAVIYSPGMDMPDFTPNEITPID